MTVIFSSANANDRTRSLYDSRTPEDCPNHSAESGFGSFADLVNTASMNLFKRSESDASRRISTGLELMNPERSVRESRFSIFSMSSSVMLNSTLSFW
jgi:hypothetical protein